MPGRVERRGNYYVTHWGNRTYRHTTRRMAEAQLRLLQGLKHGMLLPRRFPKGGGKKGRRTGGFPGPRYPT